MRGFLCKFSLAAWNTGTEGLDRKLLKLATTDAQSPTAPHHSSPNNKSGTSTPLYPPSHPRCCPRPSDRKFGQVFHCSCCCHETGTHHSTNEREWPLWFYTLFLLHNPKGRIVDTVQGTLWFKVLKCNIIIESLK